MIYLPKKTQPKWLIEYRSTQFSAELEVSYGNLSGQYREKTVSHLLFEQNKRCCFCQQLIDERTTVIEHLFPQNYTCNGVSLFKDFDLQYWNMYACCNTKGQCTDSKGNTIIPPFIMSEYCDELFVYNAGKLECRNPHDIHIQGIINSTLNLNNDNLVRLRRDRGKQISEVIKSHTVQKLKGYIKNYNGPFPGLMLQVCNQKLKLLTK